MKKIIGAIGSALILVCLVLVVRTLLHVPEDVAVETDAELVEVNQAALLQHMSEAVQFKTVSYQSKELPKAEFEGFIAWLIDAYPEVQSVMELNMVGGYTMLYKWQGTDPALKPVLLTGHYDVVPVIPGTEEQWTHPPYEGVVADGYVWGRGFAR